MINFIIMGAVVLSLQSPLSEVNTQPYYDVPISEEVQEYTLDLCIEYDIPMELVLSLIEVESGFDSDVISRTDDYGLMQINAINHEWLNESIGVEDFLNPKENIHAGVYILSYLCHKYEDYHLALMAYNYGEGRAKYYWDKGIYTSKYSEKVVEIFETYKRTEDNGGGKS